jgi:hypothetical protein
MHDPGLEFRQGQEVLQQNIQIGSEARPFSCLVDTWVIFRG